MVSQSKTFVGVSENLGGRHSIDLFMLSNNKLPLHVIPMADDQTLGLDVLLQQWDGQEVYAGLPTTLLASQAGSIRE